MKKKLIIGLIVLLIFLGVIWGSNIIKCEILTLQHKSEFVEQYKQTNIINNVDYLKIISYDDNEATVYYVSKNKHGNILKFKKHNDLWLMDSWDTVWSKSGSADGFIWPYIR